MKLIICIDDKNGYCFNNRRQTRDRLQRAHLLSKLSDMGENVAMSEYTYRSYEKDVGLCDMLYKKAVLYSEMQCGSDNWYLCECDDLTQTYPEISELIIYRWNRLYLSDRVFDDAVLDGFTLCESETFVGSSHDNIEYRYYKRAEK